MSQLKSLFKPSADVDDKTVLRGIEYVQNGTLGMFFPREYHGNSAPISSEDPSKILPNLSVASPQSLISPVSSQSPTASLSPQSSTAPTFATRLKQKLSTSVPAAQQTWPSFFPKNVDVPSLSIALSDPDARFETTAQLAHANNLLRTCLSPSLVATRVTVSLEPFQQAWVDALLQDEEGLDRIRWLTTRVIKEFMADILKSSGAIAEVVLLAPFLDQEYHRKLLNCLIGEFETAKLLDIDPLQGIIQLVQCAGPDYLLSDDLDRILVILRTCLQDIHQQSSKLPYYLTLALSVLLDVMVEGKVKDLKRAADHELLSAVLNQFVNNQDPYLRHQATYALQALLHVPKDETRRQFVLRHAGNITMGLLGIASVCKLDSGELKNGVDRLYKAAGNAHEVRAKIVAGVQSLLESGRGLVTSIKGGILSGRRKLWYTALREAQEHIRSGRLADFNRLVLEAPCHLDVEFQWGVCQLLAGIAIDPLWDVVTRQSSIDFLAEMYRNDSIYNPDEDVARWILNILLQVVTLPDSVISAHAQLLLYSLEKEGDAKKQAVCRDVLAGPLNRYPLKIQLPSPSSSPLLDKVQAAPAVNHDIHTLKLQRLSELVNAVYIPLQAKPTLKSDDDSVFPLMEKAQEFLASHQTVLLLLGDSGAGKSTFNLQLEHTLWNSYKAYGPIPLYVNLPTIDDPAHDLIEKQLWYYSFSEDQIQELKLHRKFVLICDGYDESQLTTNLYTTNRFNQPGQWQVKVVISCRSQYLGANYRSLFQPQSTDHHDHVTPDLFQEAVIAPFSRAQIERYVDHYVKGLPVHDIIQDRPSWTKEEYMDKLAKVPKLMELVSNPFLLTLSLHALPDVVGTKEDASSVRLTRVQLYDGFVKRWLDVNKMRLEASKLSGSERLAFDLLLDDDFYYHGIQFQKDFAAAVFREHAGNPVVQYTPLHDDNTWKSGFFHPNNIHIKLLRESSAITRSGNFFRFIHKSLLEYFYSRTIYDPLDYDPDSDRPHTTDLKDRLAQRSIIGEPSVLQFLTERVEMDHLFKTQLLDAIEDSKTDGRVSQAAANAISILVRAGTRFIGADLRGIKVPGADLRGGQFDSADLEGADLSDVNLSKAWLRQTNFREAQMSGVRLGELAYITVKGEVWKSAISTDGQFFVMINTSGNISVYFTRTWYEYAEYCGYSAIAISPANNELAKARDDHTVEIGNILNGESRLVLTGHEDDIWCIAYSHDGILIATVGGDTTVRIWSTLDGACLHILRGHSQRVGDAAFSPAGSQLASCSDDKTVRVWDARTGDPSFILEDHTDNVLAVAYSPNGCQLASCGLDGAVRLWDPNTGVLLLTLPDISQPLLCLAYSLDGHQLTSGSADGIIFQWDSHSGELSNTLSGHLSSVTSVVYASTGEYLASGSKDGTARLWTVESGLSDVFSYNHMSGLSCVAFSPDGEQVSTGTDDGTLQLLDTVTGEPEVILKGHKGTINTVVFSPCGRHLASGGEDCLLRLWCCRTKDCVHDLEGHTKAIVGIAFSPVSPQIASGSQDTTIRVWNTVTGALGFILKGHGDHIHGVAYSPSGLHIASCSTDKTIRLWCSQTGEVQRVLDHNEQVNQLMYSSSDQALHSVSIPNGVLYVWNLRPGERFCRGKAINGHVEYCSILPDGEHMATGGRDETLQLWKPMSGGYTEVFRFKVGRIYEMKWIQSADGLYAAILDLMGVLCIWKLTEAEDGYNCQLQWSTGTQGLNAQSANVCDAVGLSADNVELLKQRGAITESGPSRIEAEEAVLLNHIAATGGGAVYILRKYSDGVSGIF